MKSLFILFFTALLLNCRVSFAQDSTWNWMVPVRFVPSVAYVYQKTHNLQLTAGVIGFQKNHNYILLRGGVDILKRNVWYLAPVTTIVYYHELRNLWSAVGNLHFWSKKVNGIRSTFLTPETGIASGPVHLTYGYNIPLSTTTNNVFGNHRATRRCGF